MPHLDMDKETRFLGISLVLAVLVLTVLFSIGNCQAKAATLKDELRVASQEAAAEADAAVMPEWQEFLSHNTLYADEHHLWFSWYGYKNPTVEDLFRSYTGWWGCPVPIRLERYNDVFFILDFK
jgi:hypothetical protein